MDFDALKKELESNGAFRSAAESAQARKLMQNVDGAALERAAKNGDAAALKGLLGQVLATSEGRRLAEQVRKAVKNNG